MNTALAQLNNWLAHEATTAELLHLINAEGVTIGENARKLIAAHLTHNLAA